MERSLELAIWDHDRIGKTQDFLGGARYSGHCFKNQKNWSFYFRFRFNLGSGRHLGRSVAWMDGTGKEVSLWQQMLDRPNFWVEGCIGLRPSLDTRPVQWSGCVNLCHLYLMLCSSSILVAYIQLPEIFLWVHYLWYGHKWTYSITCDMDMSVTDTTIFVHNCQSE